MFLSVLLSAFCIFGLVPDSPAELLEEEEYYSTAADYKIGAGDVLNITVYGEEDLTKEVRVSETGSITYPLLGQVKVRGLTATELEKMLKNSRRPSTLFG